MKKAEVGKKSRSKSRLFAKERVSNRGVSDERNDGKRQILSVQFDRRNKLQNHIFLTWRKQRSAKIFTTYFAMNFNQLFFTEVERGIDYTQNESEKQFLRRAEVGLKSLFIKRETRHLGALVGHGHIGQQLGRFTDEWCIAITLGLGVWLFRFFFQIQRKFFPCLFSS